MKINTRATTVNTSSRQQQNVCVQCAAGRRCGTAEGGQVAREHDLLRRTGFCGGGIKEQRQSPVFSQRADREHKDCSPVFEKHPRGPPRRQCKGFEAGGRASPCYCQVEILCNVVVTVNQTNYFTNAIDELNTLRLLRWLHM
jgi:hypothetical protein